MYNKAKNFLIGEALKKAQTVFDVSKLELMFNIILIYLLLYILGTIPVIEGGYTLIVIFQIIGFSFILAMAAALKITKSIRLPRVIWFISGIVFTLSSALLNYGQASFITYAFSFVNVVISFLVLGRFLRNIAITYYVIFLIGSVSISLNALPKINLPFDLTKTHEFFLQPNIYAVVIALVMMAFIIETYVRTYQRAKVEVFEQKETVIYQKELIEQKNETIKQSIELVAEIQADSVHEWPEIKTAFSEHFYYHTPKQKLAGEFFWEKGVGGSVYFALIDTGEVGVPGAMFSYLIKNGLNKLLNMDENPSPKSILHSMNQFMADSQLSSKGVNSNIKISLCQYKTATKTLHLAGVSHPIIIQYGDTLKTHFPKNYNLNYLDHATEFDEAEISLEEGNIFHLFTDGVSDGKADNNDSEAIVDYSGFSALLFKNLGKSFQEKSASIKNHYDSIKESGQQKDDITIISIKV